MVEVSQSTIDELEKIAEQHDVPMDDVTEQYKEKYDDVESRTTGVSDSKIEELALRQFRSQQITANRVPTEEVEMLTVGGDVVESTPNNNLQQDTFFGTAVVDENPNDDSSSASLGAVNVFDEGLAHQLYGAFDRVGNIVSGNFSVSDGDLPNQVNVGVSEDTEFDVHRPDNRNELVDEIRSHVPETSIASIADDLSAETRGDNGNMYTVSSDIRRIEADVIDGYMNPDDGVGIYTLRDDTVFDEQDVVESPVFDESEANENATPGLTCFFDDEKMEWGSGAIVEFFGTVEKSDDGTINFSADGAVPILENEEGFDGYTDSNDDSEDDVPERTSGGGSSVDRTQI